jgi:Family of unknown function (DUF6445)
MKPFKPVDVFAVHDALDIQAFDLGHGDKGLIIDDFYKNPDEVRALCINTPTPIWKNVGTGKNGEEYWDCRHQWLFFDKLPFLARLMRIIEENYDLAVNEQKTPKTFTTNIFKWSVDQPEGSVGNIAHFDSIKVIAANIYLNTPDEQHGGTAIYRSKVTGETRLFAEDFEMLRSAPERFKHLAEDGRCYYDLNWQEYWELERVLEMKYNRVAIYPGYFFHGAYHVGNAFRHYPRMTQTCFIDCVDVPNEKNYHKLMREA